MLIKNGLVFNSETGRFDSKNIVIENGVITQLGAITKYDGEILDARRARIIPGLVDVHTHGRAGFDFLSCSDKDLCTMASSYAKRGVTCVMPTLASASLEDMLLAVDKINKFEASDDGAAFCGVHIEGRYLNPQKAGAHKREYLSELRASELEADVLRECRALHITAALELDADGSFLEKALEIGATVALGHTNASYASAKLAEERGATAYTHLFNTMPPLHHRDGGAVCAAFDGSAFAELICDGIHISPEMLSLAYRLLTSRRTVLISDSMEGAGCPDGEYSIAGNTVIMKDGRALTTEGALAGSTLDLFAAMSNLCKLCGVPLSEAVLCATANPCREVGVYDKYGSIDVGKSADMIILEIGSEPRIDKVILRGKLIDVN